MEPLELKGKASRSRRSGARVVRAEALVASARRADGRARARARALSSCMAQAWSRTRSCQLFTVLGAAGVGKSRLVAEFLGGPSTGCDRRSRSLPLLRGGHHVLAGCRGAEAAARAGPRRAVASRRSATRLLGDGQPRGVGRGDRLGDAEAARGASQSADPSWSSSTTSTGARRRSSISSSTSPTLAATRRSCCSAWRGPSCSIGGRLGWRQAERDDGAPRAARRRRRRAI